MDDVARKIRDKAHELGYEKCGIIKISEVSEYSARLKERCSRIFLGGFQYARFRWFAEPQKRFPWAKSIIALITSYAGYNVPEGFDGVYGKAYMFDTRLDENCREAEMRREFASFLDAEGLKAENEPKFGITALRWAAYKAGLGIIRHNNFFYTENGSWCTIEAWLVDREMELITQTRLEGCLENCQKCVKACPTGSLSQPYTMSLMKCASFITTMSADMRMGAPSMKTAAKLGSCLYGCDMCQTACPFNKGKFTGGSEFPGLKELSVFMGPEKIMSMDYKEIERAFADKYWYISLENLWKWKINALVFMNNNYTQRYEEPIKSGIYDQDRRVRAFAKRISTRLLLNLT